MGGTHEKSKDACALASQTAGRYGRLALARAAGEAAAAQRQGDNERSALWASVVATLRAAIMQTESVTA